ncbi:MAG: hypothetical protein M3P42_01450 [Actinomycetota bacterium]|nr:hypothetical protein [Actinomycetota bacterium]
MDETPYRLAYEASVRAVDDQATVLEGVRSRAGTMFAAAALVTTFLGGGLFGEQRSVLTDFEPWSLDGVVVASFIGTALLTLAILWPFRFRFSISAADMIAILEKRTEDPVTTVEAYREVALSLENLYDRNRTRIVPLLWCFRGAILCLVIEVAAWMSIVWRI